MKRFLAFLLALVILLTSTACGSAAVPDPVKTQEYTDSTGRIVAIPVEITKIAITGPLSQVYILP